MTTAVIDRPGLAAAPAGERLHALDALRGFALLCGVVLHAAMSYLPGFDVWPLLDRSTSTTLGVSFFVIHMFRMTVFFVIAGFFARLLVERRGVRAFVRNRSLRIVVPLVVGWIVFFPMMAAAMWWGLGGQLPRPAAGATPPTPPALAFPLTHLWFLYVLTLLYAAALPVRGLVRSMLDTGGRLRARYRSRAPRRPARSLGGVRPGRAARDRLPRLDVAALGRDPHARPVAHPEPAGGRRVLGRLSCRLAAAPAGRAAGVHRAPVGGAAGSGERADCHVPVDRRRHAIGRDGGLRSADGGLRRAVRRGGMGVDAGPHRHRAALLRGRKPGATLRLRCVVLDLPRALAGVDRAAGGHEGSAVPLGGEVPGPARRRAGLSLRDLSLAGALHVRRRGAERHQAPPRARPRDTGSARDGGRRRGPGTAARAAD